MSGVLEGQEGSLPEAVIPSLADQQAWKQQDRFRESEVFAEARPAKEAGVELLVLDDGWFGHRDDAGSPGGGSGDPLGKASHFRVC